MRRGANQVSAADVCAKASHEAVASAVEKLGPVTGMGGTLDQSTGTDATLLAGEQVAHLMEAWQYMGAAVRSVLCNAGENSLHFAYYAQLRSVISIFAGSGIRLSLGKCFYLDGSGNKFDFELPKPVQTRTHPLAWAIWDEWVKTGYAQDLMGKNISIISGISLSSLALIPSSSGALLGTWGYDLARGKDDHHARNNASYRAKSRQASPQMDAGSVDLVRDMWTLLLESGGGVLFDATLVRYFVERHISASVRQAAEEGQTLDPQQLLSRVIEQTSANTGVAVSTLDDFFKVSVNTRLFEYASAQETKVENVVSRALFLLRVATLALATNLGGGSGRECKNWICRWLEAAGLYDPSLHDGPSEIAADYEGALEDFDLVDVSKLPQSVWAQNMAQSAALLARPEGFVGWALPL